MRLNDQPSKKDIRSELRESATICTSIQSVAGHRRHGWCHHRLLVLYRAAGTGYAGPQWRMGIQSDRPGALQAHIFADHRRIDRGWILAGLPAAKTRLR